MDKAADPANWVELAKSLGPGNFLGIVVLLLAALAGYVVYRATIGPGGFVRVIAEDLHARAIAFATRLEGSLDQVLAAAKRDESFHAELRRAAREFAGAMRTFARERGVDVEKQAAAIEAAMEERDDH